MFVRMAFDIYRDADMSLARPKRKQGNVSVRMASDIYMGADKSLARPGRKQANVSVRMACEFPSAPCLAREKKYDSSRLDVVEIARVHDVLPSLFHCWSG